MKDNFLNRQGQQYTVIANYDGIPGFISENEAVALYDTAKQLTNNSPTVVEIGSLVGKSSFVIAKGLERKTTPKLYCIDPFVGVDPNDKTDFTVREEISQIQNELGVGKYKNTFIANMTKFGVIDKIQLMEGYSHQFTGTFDKPIDFLFIDGSHEPGDILRDYLDWSPKIKPEGYIAIHDVYFVGGEHEGPNNIVQQYLVNSPGKNNQQWAQQKLTDCLFIAKKIGQK